MEPLGVAVVAVLAFVVGAVAGAWWRDQRPTIGRARRPATPRSRTDAQGPGAATLDVLDSLVADSVRRLATWLSPDRPGEGLAVADDGTLTLLFSDIAGSTTLNRRLGDDAFATLLADHDERADAVVRARRGQVVKTQGDGFMAAFRDPGDAVRAAVDLRDQLADPAAVGRSLDLRIGIHAGEVVTTGGDVFGETVAYAARVASAAQPGEVLASEAVRERTEDVRGVQWAPRLLPVRLKGLPGLHRLHRARGGPG